MSLHIPTAQLDQLEKMVNEVLVQTGKALRSSAKDGKTRGTLLPANISKIHECNQKFNVVLDDLEMEVILAKGAFLRDLEQLRAARRPPPPPVAPPAPMVLDLDPFEQDAMPAPPPLKSEGRQIAPFPNMGGSFDVPSSGSPPNTFAVKEEKASPKPKALPKPAAPLTSKAGMKASPKPSQAAHTKVPVVKPEAKPEPVSQPHQGQPASSTDSMIVDEPSTSVSGAAAAAAAATSGNPEFNFTDMHFSLEPSLNGDPQQGQDSSGFYLTSFISSSSAGNLSNLPLSNQLTSSLSNNLQQQQHTASAATGTNNNSNTTFNAPMSAMVGADKPKPPERAAPAPEPDMDDLFDLGESSFDNLNADLDVGGDGLSSSNFNELFFDDGDTEMGGSLSGEFDNAYFGLE